MKKLTNAQEKVLNEIRQQIVLAKTSTFYRFVGNCCAYDYWNFVEKYPQHPRKEQIAEDMKKSIEHILNNEEQREFWHKVYLRERNEQITVCIAHSGTLRVLEKMGLVKIVHDAANEKGMAIDRVQLLEEIPIASNEE